MLKKPVGLLGALVLGLGLVGGTAVQASAEDTAATDATIEVPGDFVPALSDTRAAGHYEVVGTGLHVWTEGTTSTDKVAEYVATDTPLADAGEPGLTYAPTEGDVPPGFQLVVDFDADGTPDGILVGEPAYYGNDWWLSNDSADFVKDAAPSHEGGSGSENHGTLEGWRTAFPDANVLAFGFSLGSGVFGDGVIESLTFAGTTYTFEAADELTGKKDCKKGGWATSTDPTFRNQGQCVKYFVAHKRGKKAEKHAAHHKPDHHKGGHGKKHARK